MLADLEGHDREFGVEMRGQRIVDHVDARIADERLVTVIGHRDAVLGRKFRCTASRFAAMAATFTSLRRAAGSTMAIGATRAAPMIPIVIMRFSLVFHPKAQWPASTGGRPG